MQRRSIEQALPPDAVSSHSKVTLLIRPTCASYVAGQRVEGVIELSCNSERAWLGKIGIELVGQETLQHADNAAHHCFLTERIQFQSPQHPPSNAVHGERTSSSGYWQARTGKTRFAFSFTVPADCPSSCLFGRNATAAITYTLTATCQIMCGQERSLLMRPLDIRVFEQWPDTFTNSDFREAAVAQARRAIIGRTIQAECRVARPLCVTADADGKTAHAATAATEAAAQLYVRNSSDHTLAREVRVELCRRLRLISAKKYATVPPPVEIVSRSTISAERCMVAAGGERWMDLFMDVSRFSACGTVRSGKLFTVETFLRMILDIGLAGISTEQMTLEVPLYVAHPHSLPLQPIARHTVCHQPMHTPPISNHSAPQQYPLGRYEPCHSPYLGDPHGYTASPAPQYHAGCNQFGQMHKTNAWGSQSMPAARASLPHRSLPAPELAQRDLMSAPPTYLARFPSVDGPTQPLAPFSPISAMPLVPRHMSASPASYAEPPRSPQRLTPRLRQSLDEADQARALANMTPTSYNAAHRMHLLQRAGPDVTSAEKRELFKASPKDCSRTRHIQSNAAISQAIAMLVEDSKSPGVGHDASSLQGQEADTAAVKQVRPTNAEASRRQILPRSSSWQSVHSVTAVRATLSNDSGDTSATLLEDLVDQLENQQTSASALAKPEATDKATVQQEPPTALTKVQKCKPEPHVQDLGITTPTLAVRPSYERVRGSGDALEQLEARLLRSVSPVSAPSSASKPPAAVKTDIKRAVSPYGLHIGNAGALRKRSLLHGTAVMTEDSAVSPQKVERGPIAGRKYATPVRTPLGNAEVVPQFSSAPVAASSAGTGVPQQTNAKPCMPTTQVTPQKRAAKTDAAAVASASARGSPTEASPSPARTAQVTAVKATTAEYKMIRSPRGGRGGKVKNIASIWAIRMSPLDAARPTTAASSTSQYQQTKLSQTSTAAVAVTFKRAPTFASSGCKPSHKAAVTSATTSTASACKEGGQLRPHARLVAQHSSQRGSTELSRGHSSASVNLRHLIAKFS